MLDEIIKRRPVRPISPDGEDIEWTDPYLIFLAENGSLTPSKEAELREIEKLREIVFSLPI